MAHFETYINWYGLAYGFHDPIIIKKLSGEVRTAIELFIGGVRGWDVGLWRLLDTLADGG
jgi:hypothetical protein